MKFATIAVFCVAVAWTCVAEADISGWTCKSDGDGAINCAQTCWSKDSGTGDWNLTIKGDQFCGPGHMLMDFSTDSGTDPTIKSINEIGNDTPVDWTGYLVTVTLDTNAPLNPLSYSIANPVVTLPGPGFIPDSVSIGRCSITPLLPSTASRSMV